ncbi:MAG: hypothetical protein ACQEQG_10695 [Bacillota bacterium]
MGILHDLLKSKNDEIMKNINQDKFRDEHINKCLQECRDYLSFM